VDLVSAAMVRYLKSLPDVCATVGAFPPDDPVFANRDQPYVFHVGQQGDVLVRVEGSGETVIAVSFAGSFQGGDPGSTVHYERVSVEFWVDPARDGFNNIVETGGLTLARAMETFYVADSHLHRREPGANVAWGDLVTVACWRMVTPEFYLVPDGDGALRGQAYYAVTSLGWLDHAI
jgi:hypothetical protein